MRSWLPNDHTASGLCTSTTRPTMCILGVEASLCGEILTRTFLLNARKLRSSLLRHAKLLSIAIEVGFFRGRI